MNKDRFKFRAWNKEEKKMYYDAQNTYDYMTGEPIIFAESFGCLLNNDEEWGVEQCTGLKDKNGNLIYEGDIVKDSLLGHKYTVNWDCDNVQFEATAKVNCYDTEFSEIYGLCVDSAEKLEIIGNIHEQKDNK